MAWGEERSTLAISGVVHVSLVSQPQASDVDQRNVVQPHSWVMFLRYGVWVHHLGSGFIILGSGFS